MKRALLLHASTKHATNKLFFFLVFSAGVSTSSLAQTKIGDNPATPRDPSAMLEVSSTAAPFRGFLMPRLTSAQRDAMTSPAVGLMIFNTTTNRVEVNTGSALLPLWTLPVAPTPGSWTVTGNAGIDPANSFLGTTDGQPVILRTNNAERLRVTANGNVGIGTTTANSLLSFPSTDGVKITLWDNPTGTAHYGFGITGTYLNYHVVDATAVHRFYAGGRNGDGTELMRIQGDGNVGIGTNNPAQKLDVAGTARISGSAGTATAIVGRNAAGDISNLTLGSGLSITGGTLNTTAAAGWGLTGNTGTNAATNFMGNADAQPLVIRTDNTERLRVTANGNVGIGTTTANSLLSFPSNDGVKITLWDNPAGTAHYGFGITGNYLNYHVVDATAVHRFFAGGRNGDGTELMRIQGNGNVGIGTNNPSATLSVNGAANNTTGVWGIFSDARIKTVDEDFTDGLSTVMKIRPVKFRYNADAPFKSDEEQIGIVAQEIEAIAPYMISKVKAGNYTDLRQYNAQALPYLLVNAVQELKNELDVVKKENEQLKAKVAGMANESSTSTDVTVAELLARIKKLEGTLGVAGK